MHHPRTLATAILVLLVGSFIGVQSLNHKPAEAGSAKAELVSMNQPWHMVEWLHGTTTTTTPVPPPPIMVAPAPPPVQHHTASQPRPQATGGGAGGFAACVRQHESGGNYGTNTGNGYHGAYQMTNSHWGGYDGYPSAESAPPSVQDAKFQDDMSHGSAYMHQQYPQTSRMCGG